MHACQINDLTRPGRRRREREVPKTSEEIKNRAGLARFALFHFCNSVRITRTLRRLKCFDAGRQARQLARRGVLVQQAFGDATMHLRHHRLEGRLGRTLVAALERFLDLADEGSNPASARLVAIRPSFGLPDPFLGADRMCHCVKTL